MLGVSRPFSEAARLRRRFAWALLGAAALHAVLFAELGRTWRAPVVPTSRVSTALWVHKLDSVEPTGRVSPAPQPTSVAQTSLLAPVPQPTQIYSSPGRSSAARRARDPDPDKTARVEPSTRRSLVAGNPLPAGLAGAAPSPQKTERADLGVTPTQLVASVVDNEPRTAAIPQAAPHQPETAGSATPENVPVYATRVPAPAVLQYRMRRGILHGNAELTWRLDAGHYEARLEARASGITLLMQVSQGDVAVTGLVPQRFTDKRVRRSAVAANFQREGGAGRISFSGGESDLVLHAGTQDRLSWMVQLAAIASAEPQLLVAQGKIAMHVVGARGDAAVWQFQSSGEETLGASPVAMRVFRLQRLPQTPYDTQVDVWLDAESPHWPVRAHWRSGPQDSGMEMWRIDISEPP